MGEAMADAGDAADLTSFASYARWAAGVARSAIASDSGRLAEARR